MKQIGNDTHTGHTICCWILLTCWSLWRWSTLTNETWSKMAFVENFPNSSNKINNFFYSLRSLNCFHRCWKFLEKSNQTNKNFQVKIVFSIWRINQSIDQIRSMFDCYEQYLFSAIIKSSISIMMQMFRWMISTKFLFLLISFDIWLTGLRKKRAWTIMLIKQTNKPKIHCTNLMTLWICWESFFQREIHMDNHL